MSNLRHFLLKFIQDLFVFTLFFIIAPGCNHFLPSKPEIKQHTTALWTSEQVREWFRNKKTGLRIITARAGVEYRLKKSLKRFNAYFLLNDRGEGRIEIEGPLKDVVCQIVFDPDAVYCYIPGESRLFLARNDPDHIVRLIGIPLDLSLFFDLVTSNLPTEDPLCKFTTVSKRVISLSCFRDESGYMNWKAAIVIEDFPIVEEMFLSRGPFEKGFKVKYIGTLNIQDFFIPRDILFSWDDEIECHITFKSAKINQPATREMFIPDKFWFRGEVVRLYE